MFDKTVIGNTKNDRMTQIVLETTKGCAPQRYNLIIRWLATAVAQRPELETNIGCSDSPS